MSALLAPDRALDILEAKAEEWSTRARTTRAIIEQMRAALGAVSPAPARASRARPGRGAGATCAVILREWGRPARVGELLPALRRRGVIVGGAHPPRTLSATLLRYSGVRRVSRGLWEALS